MYNVIYKDKIIVGGMLSKQEAYSFKEETKELYPNSKIVPVKKNYPVERTNNKLCSLVS